MMLRQSVDDCKSERPELLLPYQLHSIIYLPLKFTMTETVCLTLKYITPLPQFYATGTLLTVI